MQRSGFDTDYYSKDQFLGFLSACPVHPYEADIGLDLAAKAENFFRLTKYIAAQGISVTFASEYEITDQADKDRKDWELVERDGKTYRPVPVGELDTKNHIYLNLDTLGFYGAFFTTLHLYGHRVQLETSEKHSDSEQAKAYNAITKYVAWPKPLNMQDVLNDYRVNTNRPDADYEKDFLNFEKEAFAFGIGTCQQAGIDYNQNLQYATNIYLETDFQELKDWWVSKPNKSGEDFVALYTKLYNQRQDSNDYEDITPKKSPYASFAGSYTTFGVIVVGHEENLTMLLNDYHLLLSNQQPDFVTQKQKDGKC